MDTTQTDSAEPAAPDQQADSRPHSKPWPAAVGLVFAPLTFLFGALVALLVLPFVLPPMRRWRSFAVGLFAGVVVVRCLMFMGVNPVLSYAQNEAISRLESSLGADVSYSAADGDVINGQLRFENVKANIPELQGGVEMQQLTVDAGWFLLHRPDGLSVTGRGFQVRLDADEGRLEEWLEDRKPSFDEQVAFDFREGVIEAAGGVGARFELDRARGEAAGEAWVLHLAMRRAAITFKERTHTLDVYGGLSVGDSGDGLRIETDLRAVEPELGGGIMRGSLRPGTDTHIGCTIDSLNLQPLWARYRKVDEYGGSAVGQVQISGELGRLVLDFRLTVLDYSYFHTTAMGLKRDQSFALPKASLTGQIVLIDGREIEFKDVTLTTEDATLATGPRINARGSGMVVLNGRFPKLSGRLEAVVEGGELNQDITWSREQTESLRDIAPNLILVGEQFGSLDMDWVVEVKQLSVNARPLTGSMTGTLSGTFEKEPGVRVGKLRAQGELSMQNGKVNCLGLTGDFSGTLTFNPTAPTRHASLRGQITGSLGDTEIDCEVTGEISKPGFIFSGMTMSPEALGRKLFQYSAEPLSEAELIERRGECSRVFGAYAASRQNPFEARSTGKVFFGFK